MTKIDLKRDLQHLYKPSAQPGVVEVPELNFMMIDGSGDPNVSQSFMEAVQALNSASFALKFAVKKQRGIDYAVMPTEGLWWTERLEDFRIDQPANWLWTIMILQPDFITAADVAEIVAQVKAKPKGKQLPALDLIRFEAYHEGRAAQIMHLGAYGLAEVPTVERLDRFIEAQGAKMTGKHHEIYLNDPSRTAPQNLKTVIRHPIGDK